MARRLRIDLFNLGVFGIGNDKAEANSDRITTVTAHLYCERMELYAGGAPKAITAPRTGGARKAKSRRRR